jgi:acyl-[acyl-carrier-protein] desaturase
VDTIESLQMFVGENLSLFAPVDQASQPTDYLPDLTADDWAAQVGRFRDFARHVSDELLVVLVGNMVTEEALPNCAISLQHIAHDSTGTGDDSWAQWLHGWTAEENRHGDLLNAYLRLTGRVDMRSVEQTIHHLIRNGFNVGSQGDDNFASVTQRIGAYTAQDYAEIIQHLNDSWGISHLSLSGKPARAQDYLCRQPERYERLAGEIADRLAGRPAPHFSWIHGRSA